MRKVILLLLFLLLGTAAWSAKAAVTSYLGFGSRGSQVIELQNILMQRDFYHGPITGYFGYLTRNAVISFQAANKIPMAGVVGPLTRRALSIYYHQDSVTLYSLSPSSGIIGTSVTINGNGFTENSKVHFDSQVITPTFINSSTLTFVVPSDVSPYCPPGAICAMYLRPVTPGKYSVNVYEGNTVSNNLTFTVVSGDNFSINSIAPATGSIGTRVTLKGSGFAPTNLINFGSGFISNPIFIDSNTLAFDIPSTITGGCKPPMMCPNYIVQVTPGLYDVSVYQWNGWNSATSNIVKFTVIATSNHAPVISGVSGPTTLSVNQTGTWTVQATDPDNSELSYSVLWGDEANYGAQTSQSSNSFTQQTTFTHTYAYPGTYTIKFNVRNSAGNNATSTMTVNVNF